MQLQPSVGTRMRCSCFNSIDHFRLTIIAILFFFFFLIRFFILEAFEQIYRSFCKNDTLQADLICVVHNSSDIRDVQKVLFVNL